MKTKSFLLVLSGCVVALAQSAATTQGQQPLVHHKFTASFTGRRLPSGGALSAGYAEAVAEDGTIVYRFDDWYKSAGDARNALDKLIGKASRVIKQGTKKDPKVRIIGKRVELAFNHGRKASPEMVIAWTDGTTVVRLSSTSLPLLLDFESQYYPGNSETTRN